MLVHETPTIGSDLDKGTILREKSIKPRFFHKSNFPYELPYSI